MGASLSTIGDILKIDYMPPVIEALNNTNYFWKKVQKWTKPWSGLQVKLPVHISRNVGVGPRAEDAALPSAGAQGWDTLDYTAKYFYGTIRLTGQALASTKGSAGSFVRILQAEMSGLTKDLKRLCSRMCFMDGSGILTVCGTTSSSANVEVESTKFLQVGMPIEIRAISGGTAVANGTSTTVSSITDSDTFVNSAGATDTTSSHAVFLTGSRNGSSWGTRYDTWGLAALVSNSNPSTYGITETIGGVTRTGNAWHQANSLTNSGTNRDLKLNLLQQAYDESEIEGAVEPGLILTNHAGKRVYGDLLVADKRYPAGGEIKLDGGYSALEFNGVPMVADRDCCEAGYPQQLNGYYFLDMTSMARFVLEDWQWMQKDGAILSRAVSAGGTQTTYQGKTDAYEAAMFSYFDIGVKKSNSNTWLGDINEDS